MHKEDKILAKYLSKNSIFVVDPSSASRIRLMKTLSDLGAVTHLIKTYGNYEEAEREIKEQQPKIVLTDYKLGRDKSGFDLLQALRTIHEKGHSLFILITANSSQSLVAQAAEEEIDSFILKPYTINNFREILLKATIHKINPPEYIKTIEEGKEHLFAGMPLKSIIYFEKAKKMNPNPSLACFYHGQAEFMLKSISNAEGDYQEGLSYNTIHYQCLTHLFGILHDQKRYKEAYDVVRRIAKYFPANPNRLATVLRLSIMTENFMDIDSYYKIFTDLEERTQELVNYICSALITAGRYLLLNNTLNKALEHFRNVKATAAGNPKFLMYIIQNLAEFGCEKYAPEFLERFPADSYKSEPYLIAKFLTENHSIDPGITIKNGMNLIERKIHNYCVYLVVLRRLVEYDVEHKVRSLLNDALSRWPEKKSIFNPIIRYVNDQNRKKKSA